MTSKFRSVARSLGLAVALCFSVGPAAHATTLSNFLTFDGPQHLSFPPVQGGGEDKLQDDSLSTLIDIGTPGISIGDTLFGIITLSEISASGRPSVPIGAASQIAVLYAATVTGPGSAPGTLAFGAAAPGFLATICGAICANPAVGIGAPGTVFVVLSTTQSDSIASHDPLNWDATGANGFTGNFNGANGNGPWSWEATGGLSGAGVFFETFLIAGGLGGASERAAFNITSSAFNNPVTGFLGVDVTDFAGAVHINDLTLDTGTIAFASAEEQTRGWQFRDQSSYFVNAVPEPGALALMGIALAGLAGLGGRRRTQ